MKQIAKSFLILLPIAMVCWSWMLHYVPDSGLTQLGQWYKHLTDCIW